MKVSISSLLLACVSAIPGKSNVYQELDSIDSAWNWIERLSDRYKFNAESQKMLHNRLVLNYQRPIPKSPSIIHEGNPVTVLIWQPEEFSNLLTDPAKWVEECPVPCRVTIDKSESESAHIVLTTGVEVPEVFSIMQPWQIKALFDLEPDLSLPSVSKRVGPFHMLTSYSHYSDIHIDYTRSVSIPKGIPDMSKKGVERKALTAAFISNCDSNGDARYRMDYLKELKVHMEIDSYGSCLHTPGLPSNVTFKEIADQYHFVLVFENTLLDDYITDKFYEALGSDAIPVYLGAPNVAEYLPDPHNTKIIIEARHYPDPASLATHLKQLANSTSDYLEYFEWRSGPISDKFTKTHDFEAIGPNSFPCRMCQLYNDRSEK